MGKHLRRIAYSAAILGVILDGAVLAVALKVLERQKEANW